MKNTQITKHTFAAIGRRMLHRLSRHLIPNVGTIVIVALLLFAYHAWAAPSAAPQVAPASQVNTGMLSYQGYLTDASGEPLTGDVDITFRLYDAPSGGAALWTEVHTNANAVPVADGLFNVMLGSLTPISSTVWSSGASYLGVQVGDDAEMAPREVVGAVPYAQVADKLVQPDSTQLTYIESSTQVSNDTTEWQDMPDMEITFSTEGGMVLINFHTQYRRSVADGAGIVLQLDIDGNSIPASQAVDRVSAPNTTEYVSLRYATELSPGTHTIKVRWKMSVMNPTGTMTTIGHRQLSLLQIDSFVY